jgi:dihydropteroate synthase
MEKALDAGADMINDQRALARPGALEVVAAYQPMVCLMHFFQPMRQAQSSSKRALLQRICDELTLALVAAREAGLPAEQLCLDPGFGGGNFGKSTSENFYLLHQLPQFLSLGQPLLVGWSRKSMLGDVLGGVGPEGRLFGGIAAATLALQRGASIIRTHDVKPTVDAVKVYQAMLAQQEIQEEQGVC